MRIFELTSYKSALGFAIRRYSEKYDARGGTGLLRRLAEACQVQRPYLSRVMNRDGHLSQDQLFLACGFLRMTTRERRYVGLLYEWERSLVPERRTQLEAELARIRARSSNTENYLTAASSAVASVAASAEVSEYYLNPQLQLVHLFLTVPKYAEEPMRIAEKMSIDRAALTVLLETLVRLGLAVREGKKWLAVKKSMHLPKDARAYPYYRVLSRALTLARLQTAFHPEDYSFTAFFSTDEKTFRYARERFMELLQDLEKRVQTADPTDVYQLSFDLLSWSRNPG